MSSKEYTAIEEWARTYFQALDAHDPVFYERYVDPDVRLIVGHNEPVVGRDAMKATFDAVAQLADSIRHDVVKVLVTAAAPAADHRVGLELSIDYALKNGKALTLPAAVFLEIKGGRTIEQRVYMDAAPLMAAVAA